jgi:hypothetical protein
MKALLNRLKTAFLFRVLTVLSWLSLKIRAEIGIDYALRGPIMANRGRSIPRPPMTLISREFAHTREAVGRWASRRKRPAAHHFAVPRPHRGLAARLGGGHGQISAANRVRWRRLIQDGFAIIPKVKFAGFFIDLRLAFLLE